MAEPQLELWSFDLIISLPSSSGAALFNLIPMSRKGSGPKSPQCQAEVAETTYQPTRVTERKLWSLQKPETSEG